MKSLRNRITMATMTIAVLASTSFASTGVVTGFSGVVTGIVDAIYACAGVVTG